MDATRLKTIPLFASIPSEELEMVALCAVESSLSAGTRIVCAGEYAHELYVIDEGSADVIRDGFRVAQLGPGDVFGEIGVLGNQRRCASVVATSPVRLITLTNWDVRRLRKRMPRAIDGLFRTAQQRLAIA